MSPEDSFPAFLSKIVDLPEGCVRANSVTRNTGRCLALSWDNKDLGLVHSHSLWTMVTVFETASSILSREHVSNAWMCIRTTVAKGRERLDAFHSLALFMNASAAIANVRERGAESEARGGQKEYFPSRRAPFAWLLCEFSTNRHE